MTTLANTLVSYLLRSPLHRMLSGSTCLIRYNGSRTGRQITTPTQYAQHGDQLIILVGRHDDKTWWRNFSVDRDIEVLLQRKWTRMTARAVLAADEPDVVTPLLEAYLRRFPKASARLRADADSSRARSVVLVWCRPPQGDRHADTESP